MNRHLLLFLLLLATFAGTEANEQKPYLMPRTQVIPIKNVNSGGQYELYVKLPSRYSEDSKTKFPVIYFTDAVWHIEILSAATEYLMEDTILVGISWQTNIEENLKKEFGAHASRFRDYSIRTSSKPIRHAKYQFGQAKKHLAFIRDDVIVYIEKHFRTIPNRRSYFGYSLGAEFGAYILLVQPDTFKNYILGSPSFKNDISSLSKLKPHIAFKQNMPHCNVFISYASLESDKAKEIEAFISMLKASSDKQCSVNREVVFGNHSTGFPISAVLAMTWLANHAH